MGAHRNTIELNGQIYDVGTGKTVKGGPKVMDGFFRGPTPKKPVNHTAHAVKPVHHAPATAQPHLQPKPHVDRPAANHKSHRNPQASKTLVRQAVSKPIIEASEVARQNEIHARTPESKRLKRAQAISKSRVISRFGDLSHPEPIPKTMTPLAVKKAPEAEDHKPQPHTKPVHHAERASPAEQHFKKALEHAHAHEKHAVKSPRKNRVAMKLGLGKKGVRVATATLGLLLLAGFFAYQNIPNISMKIAANRAGFAAQMPSYTPAGFGTSGPVQYGPGYVAVSFNSHSDDQSYKVSQRVSNWNSEALADNFLAQNDKQYQTFEDKGRTIYVYDGANATWVNGGVWYQIEGNTNLKNEQLLDIASSM